MNVERNEPLEGWISRRKEALANDPDYVAEELALDIAEQIVKIMESKGLTRSDLALMLGVNRAYITKVLNAPPNLTLRSIAAVALALRVKPTVSLIGLVREPAERGSIITPQANYAWVTADSPSSDLLNALRGLVTVSTSTAAVLPLGTATHVAVEVGPHRDRAHRKEPALAS